MDSKTFDSIIESLKKAPKGPQYKNRAYCTVEPYRGFVFVRDEDVSYEDINHFYNLHKDDQIELYSMCFIPHMGYDFIKKEHLKSNIVFFLGAQKRFSLLRLLSLGSEETFNKYLSLWEKHSEQIEYILWLYDTDRGNYQSYINYLKML